MTPIQPTSVYRLKWKFSRWQPQSQEIKGSFSDVFKAVSESFSPNTNFPAKSVRIYRLNPPSPLRPLIKWTEEIYLCEISFDHDLRHYIKEGDDFLPSAPLSSKKKRLPQ